MKKSVFSKVIEWLAEALNNMLHDMQESIAACGQAMAPHFDDDCDDGHNTQ